MLLKPPFAPGCTHLSRLKLLIGAATLVLLAPAGASNAVADEGSRGHSYTIEVPVISATPVVATRTVERPERVCEPVGSSRERYRSSDYRDGFDRGDYYYGRRDDHYSDDRYERRRSGGVGAQIIGGLIGGAIGNQFGGGNGRKALTIAGALMGSAIARGGNPERRSRDTRYDRNYAWDLEPDYVCRTTTRTRTIEDVIGYDVVYSYNGGEHSRRVERDPGDTIELRVRAVPKPAATPVSSDESTPHFTPSTRPAQVAVAAKRPRRTL